MCFHAMCCLDLHLSGFLFFLLCAFLPTYPQTLDLFLSLITSTKKNGIMLMTSFIFGRCQQSCIANLHMESLAQQRGSTIWKPDMLPLYILSPLWNVSAEPSHGHSISADTTAPPVMGAWRQPVGSWWEDASLFHLCQRRISVGFWLHPGQAY